MAIGTTVKVGFDASEVRKGFGAIRGFFGDSLRRIKSDFGKIGDTARRVRDIWAIIGDLMMSPLETMDWAGNLTDMSAQTGVAVSKLVLMEEALRLAGASANDTSRIISTLADNLNEARDSTGPARDALNKLGFLAEDFANVPIDKAFEMIGKRAASLPKDFRGLEGIMADLFGARMGFKLIRFFRDFDGGMKQAENNVGKFANRLDASAGGYDQMSDALGRFKMRWRETMAIGIDAVTRMFGTDWVDQMFDGLSPEKVRQSLTFMREELAGFFKGEGFSGMFRNIGREIGEGVMDSLRDTIPFGTSGGLFNMFKGAKSSDSSGDLSKLISQTETQTGILRQIATKQTGWA